MARRHQQRSWLQRWFRPLSGAIAFVGVLETAYLTLTKFLGIAALCPTSGCETVLSSQYAIVFGLPLTLLGCLAYAAIAILSLSPLLINGETSPEQRQTVENFTSWGMLILTTVMVMASGYLMYVMAFRLQALCLYCIASATLTVALFILSLIGQAWEDYGQVAFTSIIVGVIALTGVIAVYAPNGINPSALASGGEVGFHVTTTSGVAERSLAQHLTKVGAKMYGAWWCPHCYDQKQLFGQEALADLSYVECAPDGLNSQTALCQSIDQLKGFPTWEIKGVFYPGTQSLQDLAEISGYEGSRDFKN